MAVSRAAINLVAQEAAQRGLGIAVKHLRIARSLTQEQLAEGSGFHVTYVSQVERGLKNVSLYSLHRIAYALGVPASGLLRLAEDNAAGIP